MTGSKDHFQLALLGLLLALVGVLGTLYQIFGLRLLWIGLIGIGVIPLLVWLAKWALNIGQVVRTFGKRWYVVNGQLVIGNTLNVALRTKTLQEIFGSFLQSFGDESFSVFRAAGKRAGMDFAVDLTKELRQLRSSSIAKSGKTEAVLMDKLRLWAEYDSTTGMGIFNVDSIEFDANGMKGFVKVKNSFLSIERSGSFSLCGFLEGYIEGVVEILLGIHVEVKESECASTSGSGCCLFRIKPVK